MLRRRSESYPLHPWDSDFAAPLPTSSERRGRPTPSEALVNFDLLLRSGPLSAPANHQGRMRGLKVRIPGSWGARESRNQTRQRSRLICRRVAAATGCGLTTEDAGTVERQHQGMPIRREEETRESHRGGSLRGRRVADYL